MARYEVGTLVRHPMCPEWGLGKVVSVAGPNVGIFFRGAAGTSAAEVVKVISVARLDLEVEAAQSDPWLDHLAVDRTGKLLVTRRRLVFRDAVARFRAAYPLGFDDPAYTGGPRAAIRAAQATCSRTLGRSPEELAGDGEVEAAFSETLTAAEGCGLLPAAEAAGLRAALTTRPPAKALAAGVRRLVATGPLARRRFDEYLEVLQGLSLENPSRKEAWTVATVLPFLARPDTFGVLRPEATRAVAEMLTFGLRFSPTPNWATYALFLKLGEALRGDLEAHGLPPTDWTDVQAFVWQVAGPARRRAAS